MTEQELDKWANYYHYFYFYEDMTFDKFISLVNAGCVPKRSHVDWKKVGLVKRLPAC